jgi:hypothetical protein
VLANVDVGAPDQLLRLATLELKRKEKRREIAITAVVVCRVARWFVFKPKIPIWVKFGGP